MSYLRGTLSSVGADLAGLVRMVESLDARDSRSQLVQSARGLGPKQASFFLRQIGHPGRLAILDVHVLTYMRLAGLCDDVSTPRTLRRYEIVEDRLLAYSLGRGIPTHSLDQAIWLTMRAAAGVQ